MEETIMLTRAEFSHYLKLQARVEVLEFMVANETSSYLDKDLVCAVLGFKEDKENA